MKKKLYVTNKEGFLTAKRNDIGNPMIPKTTFYCDSGIVIISDRSEIKVDEYGYYVEREFVNESILPTPNVSNDM